MELKSHTYRFLFLPLSGRRRYTLLVSYQQGHGFHFVEILVAKLYDDVKQVIIAPVTYLHVSYVKHETHRQRQTNSSSMSRCFHKSNATMQWSMLYFSSSLVSISPCRADMLSLGDTPVASQQPPGCTPEIGTP